MENKNQQNSVKDDRVAGYLISHNITDLMVKYLVWFGFQHKLPEETIELYAREEYSASVAEAKYMAVLLGEKQVDDIDSTTDITEKIIRRTLGELADTFQKETKKSPENETFFAVMESNMEELAERMTTGVSNLESGVIEEIDNVKNIMNTCVDSILELSECSLSLLKVSRDEQKLLTSVHSDISVREKDIQEMKDILMAVKSPEKKSVFAKIWHKDNTREETDKTGSENDVPFHTDESASRKSKEQKEEDNKRQESIRKYNEIVERLNDKNHEVSVMDILNLLRTGLFNAAQAEIVTEAVKKKLTIPELIEIAKPDQSAEMMKTIMSFLMASREGEERKEKRAGMRSTRAINKRTAQKEKEEITDNVSETSDDEDDFSFS